MKPLHICLFVGIALSNLSCSSFFDIFTSSQNKDPEPSVLVEERKKEVGEKKQEIAQKLKEIEKKDNPRTRLKKVWVVPFINMTPYGGDALAKHASEIVKGQVSKNDRLHLVVERVLQTKEIYLSNVEEFDFHTIFEKAQAYGINAIMLGKITSMKIDEGGEEVGLFQTKVDTIRASVSLQLFDVATQKELFFNSASAEVTEEHTNFFGNRPKVLYDANRGRNAVAKALNKSLVRLPDFVEQIAWEGKITKIELPRFFIDTGRLTGIKRGQLLKVYTQGSPIFDEQTGLYIGLSPGRYKGTLKVVEFFGDEGTVAIAHSGDGFQEKDRVEIFVTNKSSKK